MGAGAARPERRRARRSRSPGGSALNSTLASPFIGPPPGPGPGSLGERDLPRDCIPLRRRRHSPVRGGPAGALAPAGPLRTQGQVATASAQLVDETLLYSIG